MEHTETNTVNKMCCNCKHGGTQFKIMDLTYLHCSHEDIEIRNPNDKKDTGWDSLRKFSESCESFEKKESKNN